jgi:hypothetical protein
MKPGPHEYEAGLLPCRPAHPQPLTLLTMCDKTFLLAVPNGMVVRDSHFVYQKDEFLLLFPHYLVSRVSSIY